MCGLFYVAILNRFFLEVLCCIDLKLLELQTQEEFRVKHQPCSYFEYIYMQFPIGLKW